jgi:uncharacterized protein (DUF1697 family)
MKELREILGELGAVDAKTYIQSGNAVFRFDEAHVNGLAERISREVEKRNGFTPSVQVLTRDDLQEAISANPFPEAEAQGSSLHLGFLSETTQNMALEKLEVLKTSTERFALTPRFFICMPQTEWESRNWP